MRRPRIHAIVFILFFMSLSSSAADTVLEEADGRMAIIDAHMDCISREKEEQSSIGWNDICYTDAYARQREKARAGENVINKQYDQVAQEHEDYFRGRRAPVHNDHFSESRSWQGIEDKKHHLRTGTEWFYAEYKEPGVMEQDGFLWGVHAEYTYRPAPGDVLYWEQLDLYRLQGQYASGEMDYSSPESGTIDDKKNHTFEIRGLLAKDFNVGKALASPYSGFGYRYLLDESEGRFSSAGHFGYDRSSRYFYIPVGVDIRAQAGEDWGVNVNLEYNIFIRGRQKSFLGYAPGYEDVTNDQKHGFGLRASVRLTYERERWALAVEPFIRFWKIEDSDVTVDSFERAWIEPENTTTESGLKVSLLF